MLFSEDFENTTAPEMMEILAEKCRRANIARMVVTMGGDGAVWADGSGEAGSCPAKKVSVKDTTGAGDAFFAGLCIGMTYGKTMAEAAEIGTRLAASVVVTTINVCPRYLPSEFGLDDSLTDPDQATMWEN